MDETRPRVSVVVPVRDRRRLLAQVLAALAAQGLTRPARPVGPLERSVTASESGLFDTCNMFYRRRAFDAAGGFDEGLADALGIPPHSALRLLGFGEDTVLGWAVARRGRV